MLYSTTSDIKNTRIPPFRFPASELDFSHSHPHIHDCDEISLDKFDFFMRNVKFNKKLCSLLPTTMLNALLSVTSSLVLSYGRGHQSHLDNLMRESGL